MVLRDNGWLIMIFFHLCLISTENKGIQIIVLQCLLIVVACVIMDHCKVHGHVIYLDYSV